MRISILAASLLLMTAVTVHAQVTTEDLKSRYPDAEGVFLEYNRVLDHTAKRNKWIFTTTKEFKLLVLDPKNENVSTLETSVVRGEQMTECLVRITNPGEQPREYGAEHFVGVPGSALDDLEIRSARCACGIPGGCLDEDSNHLET